MKLLLSLACLLVSMLSAQDVGTTELNAPTREAFERYVKVTEQDLNKEEVSGNGFLYIDLLPEKERAAVIAQLQKGEVVVYQRQTKENGKAIEAPDGLIHHWLATVFIPGGSIQPAMALLQDYDQHSKFYAPSVDRSKLLSRNGSDFKIYYRLRQKKVITVVMDAYYDVHYGSITNGRSTSRSYSTKIQEISDAGSKQEKAAAPDGGHGFMWRLNTYWRYLERDGGLYIQCEALSLSRDIPTGLGWMIGSYVESVPRESLVFTLGRTQDQLKGKK